jgi:ParB-like chromosome segregation protein Spo0J
MPPLSEEEYESLKTDIAEHGVRVPVVLDAEGVLIDGHHRVQAWNELREEGYEVADYPREVRSDLTTDAEKADLALRLNMQRRHLSQSQKRDLIRAKLKASPEWANHRIASLLGVDDGTVSSLRIHMETGSEIPNLKKLIGADGKEYPRHRIAEFENEVRDRQEQERREVRKALLDPTRQHRSDASIAEKLGVAESTVAGQRKAIEEDGPTVGELVESNPEFAHEVAESGQELRRGQAVTRVMYAIPKLYSLILFSKITPEELALEILGDVAGSKAQAAATGKRSFSTVEGRMEQVYKLRDWLTSYLEAVEDGDKPGLRRVK